jgi:hypothetical protein
MVVLLLLNLGRLAVAACPCNHLLDIFRAYLGGVIADVDGVVLPVEVDMGDVWLLSKGSLDGPSAT